MSHYAKLLNKTVIDVIVAEKDFIDGLPKEDNVEWVQTSYNTRGNIHLLGGTPFRKNFASVGCIYDEDRDAFIPPKPHNLATLDEETCLWIMPNVIYLDQNYIVGEQ